MRKISFFLFCFVVLISCDFSWNKKNSRLSILSWNVQNLFDDVYDGKEYKEFDPRLGKWTSELMNDRISRIEKTIRNVGSPDILLFQEVENENTLRLIFQKLKPLGYRYYSIGFTPRANIHPVAISKIPQTRLHVHAQAIDRVYPARAIQEIHFQEGERQLVVFNNHWKSRIGAPETTQRVRNATARLITERMAQLRRENPFLDSLVGGDLNESIEKPDPSFPRALELLEVPTKNSSTFQVTFDAIRQKMNVENLVFSPWLTVSVQGNYFYRGKWEAIDHFLLAPALFDEANYDFEEFRVVSLPFLLGPWGKPRRWSYQDPEGVSDHLPILLILKKMPEKSNV